MVRTVSTHKPDLLAALFAVLFSQAAITAGEICNATLEIADLRAPAGAAARTTLYMTSSLPVLAYQINLTTDPGIDIQDIEAIPPDYIQGLAFFSIEPDRENNCFSLGCIVDFGPTDHFYPAEEKVPIAEITIFLWNQAQLSETLCIRFVELCGSPPKRLALTVRDEQGAPKICAPQQLIPGCITIEPAIGIFLGDTNCDGVCDIADVVCTIGYLFGGPHDRCRSPCCMTAMDANADRRIDLADAVTILSYLFRSRPLNAPDGSQIAPGEAGCRPFPESFVPLGCDNPCSP